MIREKFSQRQIIILFVQSLLCTFFEEITLGVTVFCVRCVGNAWKALGLLLDWLESLIRLLNSEMLGTCFSELQ